MSEAEQPNGTPKCSSSLTALRSRIRPLRSSDRPQIRFHCHYTAMRRQEVEGRALHSDDQHASGLELFQRLEEDAVPSIRELASPARRRLQPLRQDHHLLPPGAVELDARAGFVKHTDYL